MHAFSRLAEKLLPFKKEPCFMDLVVMNRAGEKERQKLLERDDSSV
jgi:hypothetical protein